MVESSQLAYELRCEWGPQGVEVLAPHSDVVVIVDVFSFTTCVDIATARGASVLPYAWADESAIVFAESVGAELAGRNAQGLSLWPSTLEGIEPGCRLVLPSPNGSTLCTQTGVTPTLAGCLRNSAALAQALPRFGRRVAVIPAGERWPDGSLRPCFEDLCGAGAILVHLGGVRSPEARAAVAVYETARASLYESLRTCQSGREKESRGLLRDVELAAELDVSRCVPLLDAGTFRDLGHGRAPRSPTP